MLIGRRNKENSAGALNARTAKPAVAMELFPNRNLMGSKIPETPQKLKAEILSKNREIDQLRKLLDQTTKNQSGLSSPRQKLLSCDCLERHRAAVKKIEDCVSLIRQHPWNELDRACSQDALDLLQAGLALFFQPATTKARVSRRHSMTLSPFSDDLSDDFNENQQLIQLKQKVAEYSAKLDASLKREEEIETVMVKLGEACRLSETRASDYQAKCESLHSSLMTERTNAASLMVRVQEAEDDRLNLREDIVRLQDDIAQLQTKLKESQKTSEHASGSLAKINAMTKNIERLSRELAREKEFNEVQAETIERMGMENESLLKSITERDERIRYLACTSYTKNETEREALLNRINIANTAVSTLQLELQLNQKHQQIDDDSDDDDDEEEGEQLILSGCYKAPMPSLLTKDRGDHRQPDLLNKVDHNESIIDRDAVKQRPVPLFLSSNLLLPGYNPIQVVMNCLNSNLNKSSS